MEKQHWANDSSGTMYDNGYGRGNFLNNIGCCGAICGNHAYGYGDGKTFDSCSCDLGDRCNDPYCYKRKKAGIDLGTGNAHGYGRWDGCGGYYDITRGINYELE